MKHLRSFAHHLEEAFPVFVYFGGPFVAMPLHDGGHTIAVIVFAIIWGGYIFTHIAHEEQTRYLRRKKADLYTIEQKHYIESQKRNIAYDLLTDDQKREYFEQEVAKRLGGYYPYEYQEFDIWEYEQRK